jgi:hypothetical protein
MFSLARFSQSEQLRHETDPVLRQGVCVALCDYWLKIIKRLPDVPSVNRMRLLAQQMPDALRHQKRYNFMRDMLGREEARRRIGSPLGLAYEDQTTILRACNGMHGIRARLAADLDDIGAAATWTLRFPDGSGHAIAGFRGLVSVLRTVHRASVHIFDPNIGEYAGELADLDPILTDLFAQIPDYATIVEVSRTSEG